MKRDWHVLIREAPDEILKEEWARRFVRGRPPKLTVCRYCGEPFNATEMKAHIPRCPARLAADPAEIEKAKALLAYMEKKQAKETRARRALKRTVGE